MPTFIEIQRDADLLSEEERAGLAAHLLASCGSAPLGPSDDEADRRDQEMDSGQVQPISHVDFLAQVGRS
jgi:hypothetical protein